MASLKTSNKTSKIMIFAVVLFHAAHAYAAADSGGLSLEGALEEARAHSPEYRKAQAVEKEADWRKLEAVSGNLPKVAITGEHFVDVKYQVLDVNFGPGTPTTSFALVSPKSIVSISANWTVFDGFQTLDNYFAASLSHSASELELSHTAFQLEQDVRFRFFKALAAQLLDVVAEQNVKTLQDHLDKTKSLLQEGEATRYDLLRVEVQLDEATPEKLQADDNVVLMRRALSQVMGLQDDARPLVGTLPVPVEAALPKDVKLDTQNRTDLQALLRRADAAEKSHKASLGWWYPKVGFLAEEDFYNNVDYALSGSEFRSAYSVGMYLTWNIFDGGASIARQKETVYAQQQAEATADAGIIKAPNDFELWKRRFTYNVALYKARAHAIESAEESVRLAKLGFNAGSRTTVDVLDAELDLFRARAGVVQAQVDAAEAILNLELALGRKL